MFEGQKAGRGSRLRRVLALAVLTLAAGAVTAAALWPRPDPMALLDQASREFTLGRLDRAGALLDRRARWTAPGALDWILRARIAEGRDRPDEALGHLKRVSDSDPFAAQRWLLEGQIQLNRDRARAAEGALRRASALDPGLTIAHRELAYVYAMQHRQNEADAEFRALAGTPAADYKVAFLWCQNACDIWDPRETGARLAKFLAADPDDRASRVALALSRRLDGLPDEAEALLAPLDPTDMDARALRAEIALDRGDTPVAERLAAEGPADHAPSNILRGRLDLGRRDANAAARAFRAALAAVPDSRDALHGIGQALRLRGDHEDAEVYLRQARRRDALRRLILDSREKLTTDSSLFSRLAAACESVPLPRQAALFYHLAVGVDPLDAASQQALARLARSPP